MLKQKVKSFLTGQVSIAPLAVLRVLFGGVMLWSVVRFATNGWIEQQYIEPSFFFTYYGFDWVKPLGEAGMFALFALMGLSALMILLGCYYRVFSVLFFLAFTYTELIDKTNYLNHYYFISIISFLMMLVPAHGSFSLDVLRNPKIELTHVPRWMILAFQLQLGIVYFYAGFAKLNYDWLVNAQPLKIWLPSKSSIPVIGWLFEYAWVAYAFSWFGALYDISIPFLLSFRKTRGIAYFLVIGFHLMTGLLFPIGMFPYIMILLTLIFFPAEWHEKVVGRLRVLFAFASPRPSPKEREPGRITFPSLALNEIYTFQPDYKLRGSYMHCDSVGTPSPFGEGRGEAIPRKRRQPHIFTRFNANNFLAGIFVLHFLIQVLFPFRFTLYPGNLFWTEQGYRFSWRVMLMEKAGTCFFYVTDPGTGGTDEVSPSDYLTKQQEKMMSTQPDMILQFAHHLEEVYKQKGITDPEVRVESYVTLNGSGSRLFIDPNTDLTLQEESFRSKDWILGFEKNEGLLTAKK